VTNEPDKESKKLSTIEVTVKLTPTKDKTEMSKDEISEEVKKIKIFAFIVVIWLVLLIIAPIGFGAVLLGDDNMNPDSMKGILLCIIVGTLGSSISALVSAADRISKGWEFPNGYKYPEPEPSDKFVARMIPFFLIRPFLGSAMGLIVYVGIKSGYLIAVKNADGKAFSLEALIFFCISWRFPCQNSYGEDANYV